MRIFRVSNIQYLYKPEIVRDQSNSHSGFDNLTFLMH